MKNGERQVVNGYTGETVRSAGSPPDTRRTDGRITPAHAFEIVHKAAAVKKRQPPVPAPRRK